MFTLTIHPDARSDLEELWRTSRTAFARISVLLEQIRADPHLLDALTDHAFGLERREAFTVSRIESQWHKGKDLWLLKIWDLDAQNLPYRIVYGYEIRRHRYHVLGVIHRSNYNYEPDHPFTQRILRAYDDVCT